jgi:hypothetical protein
LEKSDFEDINLSWTHGPKVFMNNLSIKSEE